MAMSAGKSTLLNALIGKKINRTQNEACTAKVHYIKSNDAVEYAKSQTKNVQNDFKKKFDELNEVLKKKLQELKDYTKDSEDIEAKIKESQRKLKWLEDIQVKTRAILDI